VAYAPFGEPYVQSGTSDPSFTGMNQDTAANLYDFPAREYSIQGRWPSPDPAGLAAVDLADPQTLNRYAYVRNSPLTLVDPYGLYCVDGNGNEAVHPDGSPLTEQECAGIEGNWVTVGGESSQSTSIIVNGNDPNDPNNTANPDDSPCYSDDAACNAQLQQLLLMQPGLTLGLRSPGQTFSQCMSMNSGNYSFAGAANANNSAARLICGNDIATLAFGDSQDGVAGLIASEGGSRALEAGVGTVITSGRRTASITSLNLTGTTGPAPRILAKSAAGNIAEYVSGAAEVKLFADAGFTIAEAIGCSMSRK
jgi:RHS repeat-associated protein